jgi:hypothetical protein
MATTLNSCAGEDIVSFPLRTSITDLEAYYASLEEKAPNLSASFIARLSNPNFKDDMRTSGEVDEVFNAIEVTYNDKKYQFINAQITLPTHDDWIVNPTSSAPVQNKIDYIVTLENMQGANPRFVIIVMPIVLDDTVTVNNSYLQGLAYLSSDATYSLNSIFTGLNDYLYYTTCLAPHGDKAFVYVNRKGLKINSDLYHNLLATWTQQSLSSVQNRILDNLTPMQKSLSKLFQNVKNAQNLQEIQQQINNIQATAQTPVINSMVETWPRYSPPYDIILNVPSKTVTAAPVESNTEEGFRNRVEGFQVGIFSGGLGGGASGAGEGNYNDDDNDLELSTNNTASNTKCVPLDLDDAYDSSGNLMFNANGNIALGRVEANRKRLRDEYASKQLTYEQLIEYVAPFFAVLCAVSVFYFVAWPFINNYLFSSSSTIQPPQILVPTEATNMGSYMIIGFIFLFGGFLIGAAVGRAY